MSDFEEDLTAYIDGELSPEKARALEAAMERDPALRSLEKRLRVSIAAVEELPMPQTSPALRRAVLEAISKPTFFERWFTLPRLLPLGLALAAGITLIVWPRGEEPGAPLDEEKLLLAQNLEVVEDLDLVDLGSTEDLDVVAQLHELEVTQ